MTLCFSGNQRKEWKRIGLIISGNGTEMQKNFDKLSL